MSYPSEMSPRLAAIVEPIADRILALPPGETLSLSVAAGSVNQVRYAIYVFLSQRELKGHFRVRSNTTTRRVSVERLALPVVAVLGDTMGKPLSPIEDFVCEHLLDCADAAAVSAVLRQAVAEGRLTAEQAAAAAEEWSRKCQP